MNTYWKYRKVEVDVEEEEKEGKSLKYIYNSSE